MDQSARQGNSMGVWPYSMQEREADMSRQGQVWPHNHAAEHPLFFETLEATIPHTWVDKSR